MIAFDMLWSWLLRAAVLSSLLLIVGSVVISRLPQPIERLRLIQWVLAACLIAPWLPVSSIWRTVSMDLVGWSAPSAESASVPDAGPKSMPGSEPSPPLAAPRRAGLDSGIAPVAAIPTGSLTGAGQEAPPNRDANRSMGVRGVIVATWGAALVGLTLWGLAGLGLRFSLQRQAHRASAALVQVFEEIAGPAGKRVRLIVSDAIDSPMTWGTLHPVIVVPQKFEDDLANGELRWALAHEWSHVSHRDTAFLSLAIAVQFVCFYQPLYWALRRRMILCQDYIADAYAARHSASAEDYAAFLVRLAKSRLQPCGSPALGIVDCRSQLAKRVTMLMDSRADIRPSCRKRVAVFSACGWLVSLLLLTTVQLDAAAEPQEPGPPAGPDKTSSDVTTESTSSASGIVGPEEEPLETGVVSGLLLDAATGQPVAGARVLLRSGGLVKTESDETGRFRFEKVAAYPTGYELWAYRENLVTGKVSVKQLTADEATAVKFKPLRLEMKPGKQVHLTVTSKETGQPIPGAAVKFGYPDRRNEPTGDDGAARVSGLGAEHYDVTVEAAGYARNAPQIDLTQAEAVTNFAVALVPGGEVRGVVVDEQGKPVSGADVNYFEPGATGYFGDEFRSDSEGKFRHRFLPLNVPLEISVSKDDFIRTKQDISLSTNQRSREVRFTLPRRPVGGSVAGVVLDHAGKPVANAQVANYGNGSSQERVTTADAKGRFELHDLFDGYEGVVLKISAKGLSPQHLSVKPGTRQAPAQITATL